MNEEKEDKYVVIILLIIIILFFPIALGDSIYYSVNGTSWLYEWFGNALYNPDNLFWAGLIGTIVEILLVYYFIRKKNLFSWFNSWFKGKSNTRQSKIKGLY